MKSFSIFSRELPEKKSLVNIISSSNQYKKFIEGKRFKTVFSMKRRKPKYTITLAHSSGDLTVPLDHLFISKEGKKDSILYLRFNEEKEIFFEIEFRDNEHAIFFSNFFRDYLTLKSLKEKNDFQPVSVRPVSMYVSPAGNSKKSVLKISGVFGKNENEKTQFFELHQNDWKLSEYIEWLKHTFTQKGVGSENIVNLYFYMYKGGLLSHFEKYLKVESGSCESILREIREYEKGGECKSFSFSKILDDSNLRIALKRECQSLIDNNGRFNINFALLLKKRIETYKDRQNKEIRLANCRSYLRMQKFWWDVESCSSNILSFLLFRKYVDNYTLSLKEDFLEFEKKVLSENSLGRIHQERKSFDPKRWKSEVLDKFNLERNLEVEKMCYYVHILNKMNEIRIDLKCHTTERFTPSKSLESSLIEETKLEVQISSQKDRALSLRQKIDERISKTSNEKAIHGLRTMLSRMETSIEKMEIRMKEINRKNDPIREKEMSYFMKNNERSRQLNMEIDDLEKRLDDDMERLKFWTSESRGRFVNRYLRKHLSSLLKDGIVELPVRIIVSAPKKLENRFSKFRCHMNVQIANLGIHWVKTSLVMFCDLTRPKSFTDLIAVDCSTTLIQMDEYSTYTTITRLAEMFVGANVNFVFSQRHSSKGMNDEMKRKVSEFPIKTNILQFNNRILNFTHGTFNPLVQDYLNIMSTSHYEGKDLEHLRFLDISKVSNENEFRKCFGEKVLNRYLRWDEKDKISFSSHIELDVFYRACIDIDSNFQMNFPDVYALLSGYDLAFFLCGEEGKDCPFRVRDDEEIEGED